MEPVQAVIVVGAAIETVVLPATATAITITLSVCAAYHIQHIIADRLVPGTRLLSQLCFRKHMSNSEG